VARARDKPANDATKTLKRAEAFPPRPLGVVIRASGGGSRPTEHRLRVGTCILGSGKSADFVITNPSVSREHVEIGVVPEGVSVRDLGSRNGTFYLRQRVKSITLHLGARIEIGPVEVTLDPDSDDLTGPEIATGSYRGMIGRAAAIRRLFAVDVV
jgi:pSer/pThr/pTyr-binding forkhead associated (FHA) protein